MTLQQTVEIPADRHLHFDWALPSTFPEEATQAHIIVTPIIAKTATPISDSLVGILQGMNVENRDDIKRMRLGE
jgi:hypothetical protein